MIVVGKHNPTVAPAIQPPPVNRKPTVAEPFSPAAGPYRGTPRMGRPVHHRHRVMMLAEGEPDTPSGMQIQHRREVQNPSTGGPRRESSESSTTHRVWQAAVT